MSHPACGCKELQAGRRISADHPFCFQLSHCKCHQPPDCSWDVLETWLCGYQEEIKQILSLTPTGSTWSLTLEAITHISGPKFPCCVPGGDLVRSPWSRVSGPSSVPPANMQRRRGWPFNTAPLLIFPRLSCAPSVLPWCLLQATSPKVTSHSMQTVSLCVSTTPPPPSLLTVLPVLFLPTAIACLQPREAAPPTCLQVPSLSVAQQSLNHRIIN